MHLIATVSPGAKLGSTAPHSFAHLLLAEAGSRQPCTLANAFLAPVRPRSGLLQDTYDSLAQEVAELDANFGAAPERIVMVRGGKISLAGVQPQPLAGVASWCASQVA